MRVRNEYVPKTRLVEISSEHQVQIKLAAILDIAAEVLRCLGCLGDFHCRPTGTRVLGSPDAVWIPADMKRATVCVEVKTPWEFSSWCKKPSREACHPTMDITDANKMQDN